MIPSAAGGQRGRGGGDTIEQKASQLCRGHLGESPIAIFDIEELIDELLALQSIARSSLASAVRGCLRETVRSRRCTVSLGGILFSRFPLLPHSAIEVEERKKVRKLFQGPAGPLARARCRRSDPGRSICWAARGANAPEPDGQRSASRRSPRGSYAAFGRRVLGTPLCEYRSRWVVVYVDSPRGSRNRTFEEPRSCPAV